MKIKTLIFITFTLCSFVATSQETTKKVKEVGLTFYNFDSYGLIFKIGQEDRLWRFRALNINSDFVDNGENNYSQYSFSLSAGRERRKSVSEKINFIYGVEITGGMGESKSISNSNSSSIQITRKTNHFNLGLTGVIGIQFQPTKNWYISAELLPVAQYIFQRSATIVYDGNSSQTTSSLSSARFNFGFRNNSALLSVGLKF